MNPLANFQRIPYNSALKYFIHVRHLPGGFPGCAQKQQETVLRGEKMNDKKRKMISIVIVVILAASMVLGLASAGLYALH